MRIALYYFARPEFERGGVNWFERMDPRLLVLLDSFRHQWRRKVKISPHPSALGRELGQTKLSDHNVDIHGAVMAADVMPAGMNTVDEVTRALELAKQIGFTAIGVYPDWKPSPGLHLGTRLSPRPGEPATWGAIRPNPADSQKYVSLVAAVSRFPAA